MEAPSVQHMHAPRSQHQTALAGPPDKSGVLKVVAMEEQRPMIEKAKEIVPKFVNSRVKESIL